MYRVSYFSSFFPGRFMEREPARGRLRATEETLSVQCLFFEGGQFACGVSRLDPLGMFRARPRTPARDSRDSWGSVYWVSGCTVRVWCLAAGGKGLGIQPAR